MNDATATDGKAGEAKPDAKPEAKVDAKPGDKSAERPAHLPGLPDVTKLPSEQAVARLIEYAVNLKASDLFLTTDEKALTVQVRHLGIVSKVASLPTEQARKFISHIKVSAGMDLTERRRPLDGRWIFRREGGSAVDLRINMIPTLYGEDLALRLLDRGTQLYDLQHLGMMRDQYHQLAAILESPSGLILMTGPTGAGKTATLYACLRSLHDGRRKINTIEDPVEYAIEGLRQSQTNSAIGLTFAELLRSVLRQSPDVIMIGEIRDEETARTAVHAANSGHLVFATVHAPTAANAIQSMKALGVHPHFLAASLRGVVAQRLARTLCDQCKAAFDLGDPAGTFEDVQRHLQPGDGTQIFAPQGCAACNFTGYASRTGVFEVMPITRGLRALISEGHGSREIRTKAMEEGMLEFRQAALLKLAKGETSTEEVFRVVPAEHLILDD